MRHVIEVEETVKIRHQIVVDIVSKDQLEEVLDNVKWPEVYDIEDYVNAISETIPVLEFNEGFVMETEYIELYDDYMCEDDD